MFQRMLASAIVAGIAAGLIAALLHFAFVQNIILLAEQYETGARVHFAGGSAEPAAHDLDMAGTTGTQVGVSDTTNAAEAGVQDHAAADALADPNASAGNGVATPEPSTLQRNLLTVVFMVIIYVAYGFLLVAGFGLSEAFGQKIGAREGLLWGIAGYAVFHLAPAMGTAPELPGTVAADLGLRQIWWWMTVASTATALALFAFARHWAAYALAVAFLAVPHLIGAPGVEGYHGVAPPEVAALFSARVLGTALIVWALLGWFAGSAWLREGKRA